MALSKDTALQSAVGKILRQVTLGLAGSLLLSGIISDMSTDLLPLTILSASVALGTETEDWTLDAPAGEEDPIRSFAFEIAFATPFYAPPVVHLGLSGFDLDQCSSSRITVTAEQVNEFGFLARISTWRSSRVYSVAFNWLAIGS